MAKEISGKEISYTLFCSYYPIFELTGFADGEAIQFPQVQVAEIKKGLDGMTVKITKEPTFSTTLTFLPNSPVVKILKKIENLVISKFGKKLTDVEFVFTVVNNIDNTKTVYVDGCITEIPGGDGASTDNGASNKSYTLSFGNKVNSPF